MALKYHPDTLTGIDTTDEDRKEANDRFAKVNAAYAFLIDKSQDTPHSNKSNQAMTKSQNQDWRQAQYYHRQQKHNQYEKVKVQQSRSDDYINWHGPNMNMKTEHQNRASTSQYQSKNSNQAKPKAKPVSTKHFCKGDKVKILGGEHRGSYGKVMTVYPNMVRVEINSALSIFVEGKDVRFMTASEKSEWQKNQPPDETDEENETESSVNSKAKTESSVNSQASFSTATNHFTTTEVKNETDELKRNKLNKTKKRIPPPPPPPPPPRPATESSERIKYEGSHPVSATSQDGIYSWKPSINMSRKRDNVYQWNHDNINNSQNEIDIEERMCQNDMFQSDANTAATNWGIHATNTAATEYSTSFINDEDNNYLKETNSFVRQHEVTTHDDESLDARSNVTKTNLFKKLFKTLAFGILAANIAAAMGLVWG
jgi:ribosomal protein L24